MSDIKPILSIENLEMHFQTQQGYVRAVDGLSLPVYPGNNLGLVGESGCGKTTLVKALLRILPDNCRHMGGRILFNGVDLLQISESKMRKIRWDKISFIPQNAMNSLDPVFRVGQQLLEAITTHRNISRKTAWELAERRFEMVGLNKTHLNEYPHHLSGGMKQRVAIAMAMVLDPDLVVADEPTTALDVVMQAQILNRIKKLQEIHNGTMVIVTHDISVVAQTCNTIAVMYGGKLLEYGSVHSVLKKPFNPYTMGLKNAFPNLTGEKRHLISIPGSPPDLINPPKGCRFSERCPFCMDLCKNEEPVLKPVTNGMAACHRLGEVERLRKMAELESSWTLE